MDNSKKPTFEIKNLSTINNDPFSVNLKDINLQIKKGEIMGIAGVAGNGQNELMDILTNESDENFQGEIIFKDINISKLSTYERRKLSISFVTEQRLGHSAVPEMTLEENVLLSLNFKNEFTKNNLISQLFLIAGIRKFDLFKKIFFVFFFSQLKNFLSFIIECFKISA